MNGEAKHTPGPWEKDYGGTIGHIKSVSDVEHLTPTVCRYDVKTPSLTPEEKEANGYLIAAAPAMALVLEALQLGIASFDSDGFVYNGLVFSVDNPNWNTIVSAIGWDVLREAIARAKGE